MRGLCRSHHSQRTARETRFGRAGLEVVALLYGVEHRPGTLYSGLEISQLTLGVFDLLSRYRKLLLGAEGISEDLFVIRGHERSICPAPALRPGDGRRRRGARAKSLPVDRARLRAGAMPRMCARSVWNQARQPNRRPDLVGCGRQCAVACVKSRNR